VGESGCGKTTAGRTILKLYEPTEGKIIFEGQDITRLKPKEMKPLRSQMQMIFQDPFASLNPRHTVGTLIGAAFDIQAITPADGVEAEVQRLMARVGLNPEHINRYPHEFSGGQRQRIGVARAIALKPKLIVADEPVSALDVSIQAQVVNLLEDLQDEFNMAYIFVAHDLSVVQHISDRVIVMYLGKVMEEAEKVDLFTHPRHPYTKALLSAVPVADPIKGRKRERIILQGDLPSPVNPPAGCVFNTRCWKAQDKCRTEVPQLMQIGTDSSHRIACHYPED
jgi:oligopeptide/dipeptide ABC transporter ATP-binding protein